MKTKRISKRELDKLRKQFLSPLNIPAGKSGEWEIVVKKEPKDTPIIFNNIRTRFYGQPGPMDLTWPVETTWRELLQDGSRWMSDWPIEHHQLLRSVQDMCGSVLVGGLGLGLVATLLAKMDAVDEVIVVELEQDVINLVAKHIAHKKITVVKDDLFEYLKKADEGRFDWGFYDIWCSDGEGTFHEVVVPLRKLSERKVYEVVNWNEDVMIGQLIQGLHSKLFQIEHFDKLLTDDQKKTYDRLPKPWESDGTDQPWHNWSLRFWQWWNSTKPSNNEFTKKAQIYGSIYGKIGWEKLWGDILRG